MDTLITIRAKKRGLPFMIACVMMLVLMTTPSMITSALTYSVGDHFTVSIFTSLTGKTGNYDGYWEKEDETRRYEVIDVTNNRVTFRYERKWEYSDSDGGRDERQETNNFVIDANTRQYLDNTRDGDPAYYIFDYTWIRIDPNTPKGTKLTILGHEFVVNGKKILYPDLFTAIEVIEVILSKPYTHSVQNNDYDPDGQLLISVTEETYYYDPSSGYLIGSTWKANGQTSVGNFEWSETIKTTESSFPLPYRPDLIYQRYLAILGFILLVIIGIISFIYLQNKRRISSTIAMLEGKRSFPTEMTDTKLTSWKPMHMSYQLVLDSSMDRTTRRMLGFNDGIYLVISTDGQLGIVDTKLERKLESLVIPSNENNLRVLYQLALGIAPNDSNELLPLLNAIPELNQRLKFTNRVAEPDAEIKNALLSETTTLEATKTDQQELNAVMLLLSRRKVLDYSYGQAPLTVQSHLRKINMVLQYHPKKVLLVGDDDLLSISLARKGIQVFTLEIDPYTCALIHGIAQEENLPVQLHQVDLRDPLPPDLPSDFDVFVADPDFTIESFALFLARGLNTLKPDGIGLINFENKWGQRYKAKKILEYLKVNIIDIIKEPWNYMVVRNEQIPIRAYYYGKTVMVNYKQDFMISIAQFSSIMFVIKRTTETRMLLEADQPLVAPDTVIYDHGD